MLGIVPRRGGIGGAAGGGSGDVDVCGGCFKAGGGGGEGVGEVRVPSVGTPMRSPSLVLNTWRRSGGGSGGGGGDAAAAVAATWPPRRCCIEWSLCTTASSDNTSVVSAIV